MISLLSKLAVSRHAKVGVSKLRSWRPDVKVWRRMMDPLISVVRLTVGRMTKSHLVRCAWFARRCAQIAQHSGTRGLCLYLKASHVLLMQGLPGSKMRPGSREVGKVAVSVTRDGLPRLIPKWDRARIRSGDLSATRLWLTLFGLYRVLWFKSPLNLKAQLEKTIARPGVEIPSRLLSGFSGFLRKQFFREIERFTDEPCIGLDPKTLVPKPLPLTKTGPDSISEKIMTSRGDVVRNIYSTFHGRGVSAQAWISESWGNLLWNYLAVIGQVNMSRCFWSLMEEELDHLRSHPHTSSTLHAKSGRRGFQPGRLATKLEPAGKVRVFAMVDYWSQCALAPLHDRLFGVLREIPQDGTFDQHKPVKALLADPRTKGLTVYSFDLSAATDRCPVVLQELVLAIMFGSEFAEVWKQLLVLRPYQAPLKGYPLMWYEVGQPMGALSSWPMFTLTHHAIVQFAAFLTGYKGWYPSYALLGDDLVIAGDKVAVMYQRLCKLLGMEIGLAKSMISDKLSCEFAKVVYVSGQPCEAFPWKLWSVATTSVAAAIAAVQRSTSVGLNLTAAQVALAFGGAFKTVCRVGAKWENIPTRLRALLVILSHPSARTSLSRGNWLDWLWAKGPSLPEVFKAETMTRFTGWVNGLREEFVAPLTKRVDELTSDLIFGSDEENRRVQIPSPVERILDAEVNKKIVKFQESVEKADASLNHLQKLDINLLAYQASAIFNQVVGVIEKRVAEIPLFRWHLEITVDGAAAVKRPVSQIYSIWERWRARAFKSVAGASRPTVGRRPGSAPEPDTRLPSERMEA